MRDTLGTLYDDTLFADLFPQRGQAAQAPWQLAVVMRRQFAKNLSDRQAADAGRSRLDWKYLLGLELTDAGFDSSILSEFRQRLVAAQAEERLLNHLLVCCQNYQWLKAGGKQRTDSTQVLARVRDMNRLECVGKPCALRSTAWPRACLTGWPASCHQSGPPGTVPAPRSIACRTPTPSG